MKPTEAPRHSTADAADRTATEPARLARWLTGDMRALAKLVDEAPATTLADDEVSSAREHLMESLEAAGRAASAVHAGAQDSTEPARCEP